MSSDCLKKREHILPDLDSSPNEFCRRVPERAKLYSLSFSVLALRKKEKEKKSLNKFSVVAIFHSEMKVKI